VGLNVLTAVGMKSYIFWNINSCSPVKDNRRFGGTYRLHFQGRKVSQAISQEEAGSMESSDKDGGHMFLRNVIFHQGTRRNILEEGTLHDPNVFMVMKSIFLPCIQWASVYFTPPLFIKKHSVGITTIISGTKQKFK
jgi:hypothetical protein